MAETVEGEGFQRVCINQSEKSTRLNSWRSLVPEVGNGVGDTSLERLRPGPRPGSELSFLYSTCRLKMTEG